MKNLASFLLLIATSNFQVNGQPTFQNYYYGGGNAQNHIHEISNGHISTGVGAYSSGNSILNQAGNILHAHSFVVDTFLVLQSVQMLSDNEFIFVGAYQLDSCSASGSTTFPYTHPTIGKMDSLGNVLAAYHYVLNNPNCFNPAGDLELLSNKNIIAFNRPFSSTLFLLMTDSVGQLIWSKTFGTGGYVQFVKELPGGDLLVGMNMDSGGAAVGRMDASGNFLWLKSYIRPVGVVRDCEVENDSTITVIGYTDRDDGSASKLFMMRLNGSGDVQWCKGYAGPYGWVPQRAKLEKTNDGNFVVLGAYGKAFLMKTDMNGDTLWTRAAGVNGTYYEVYNLLAHSDGGFLFNGQGWGFGTFLFKTDSLGHLPCPEHEHHYSVEVQNLFPTDSSFTLTAIDGAVRYPATINDTIYDPVTVVEGCLITEVPPHYARTTRPRIRPNPTTGRFTVEFPDPLRANSYYSVFDSMGRLLYQRPLPTGATLEDVDLSRFGRGTYTIRFTSPDGVQHERVVLE